MTDESAPLAEQTPAEASNPDRFQMEITGGMILIVDTGSDPLTPGTRTVGSYPPAASMAAHERLETLNRRDALGIDDPTAEPLGGGGSSPSDFLSKTLPAYAARQRTEALLAEVKDVELAALTQIREGAEILDRAVKVRQTLEARLTRLVASQSDQNGSGVGTGTPGVARGFLGPDRGVFRNPEIYSLPK